MSGSVSRIAVVGAGHGGFAAAADLARRGFEVRLYGRSAGTIEPVQARGGVDFEGAIGSGFAPLSLVTTRIDAALDGADIVLLMSPTHAHAAVAELVAPHLQPGQLVIAAPGHTVLLIPEILARHAVPGLVYGETATLPYIARKTSATGVRVTRAASYMPFATFPGRLCAETAERARTVFPAIVACDHLLETVFPYTNAIHHPPAVLCNAGRIEATGGDYHHYYDGISPSVGRIIDRLDAERLAIAGAFGVKPLPLPEHFYRMGYTTAEARDSGSAFEVFHQSEPDRWIRAPESLNHRFLEEDVPYGLVLLSELGRLARLQTPAIDTVIHLASVATGRNYRAEGLTLERIGLDGLTAGDAVCLLREGYGTLQ